MHRLTVYHATLTQDLKKKFHLISFLSSPLSQSTEGSSSVWDFCHGGYGMFQSAVKLTML